ncbi:MAG: class I SAM-dependent methyltransferase [Candidatus Zixiibacteriota bacterium]
MDIFEWIKRELKPKACTSEELIYDDVESQSGRCLPIIYQPFDAAKRSHWRDRGSLFDFLLSTGGRRLLDFGPGDGWPSLIVAPFADQVVGVDGSRRRVEVCTENAGRLGISNARFVHVEPGSPLPFPDHSFDGAMAASSVDQTTEPKAALRELYRVLRPEGRLRIHYEALGIYRGGQERDVWLWDIDGDKVRLILYDRYIDEERVEQYGLTFAMTKQELLARLSREGSALSFEEITVPLLKEARPAITDAGVCYLNHASGKTMVSWLEEIGFQAVIPSHSGADFAGQLFEQLSERDRPNDMNGVDELLRPLVKIVVQMAAPIESDPPITAIK